MAEDILEYCEEYDGLSQYDDLESLTGPIQAVYIRAPLEIDIGNRFIEALPRPLDKEESIRWYGRPLPGYDPDKVRGMTPLQKFLQIKALSEVRIPLPFHPQLELYFYGLMTSSYRARTAVAVDDSRITYVADNKEKRSGNVLYGDAAAATNGGIALIGYSGSGKSSTVKSLTSRYPQFIIHTDGHRTFPQVPWLVVECAANSNFNALYEGVGEALDRALGNVVPVYKKEIAKLNSLGKKANKVAELVDLFAVSVLIFDEIQLVDFSHTKENSFDSLLTLANKTSVGLMCLGTEDALDKISSELRISRRIGTVISSNQYCSNRKFFTTLVNELFHYQWFDDIVEVNEDIIEALYDVSKGIVDEVVTIYACMNLEYNRRKTKKPEVNGEFVREVAKKYFPDIQKVLEKMDFEELSRLNDAAKERIEAAITEAEQEDQVRLISDTGMARAQETVLMENVAKRVRNISEESPLVIDEACRKVMRRKSSAGKSEKEIARAVLDELDKPARKPKAPKGQPMDLEHMQDFLKNDQGGTT